MKRTCTKCNKSKPESEFYLIRGKPATQCKSCVCARTNKHYKENRERYTEMRYWNRVKHVYGITKEQYDEMWEKQEGLCAICLHQFADSRRPCIDHDHDTGKVRAILCNPCNTLIGHCYEDPSILSRARKYLREHRAV